MKYYLVLQNIRYQIGQYRYYYWCVNQPIARVGVREDNLLGIRDKFIKDQITILTIDGKYWFSTTVIDTHLKKG